MIGNAINKIWDNVSGKASDVVTGVANYSTHTNSDRLYFGYGGTDIKDEYLVTIIDNRPSSYVKSGNLPRYIIIKAPIQDKITTRTTSTWSPISGASFVSSIYNTLAQITTGRSLVSRFASRRIWSGTSPIDFTLNLKFEAINDTNKEVMQPILELQRMCLPYSGHGVSANDAVSGADASILKKISNVTSEFFLAPPGPEAFSIKGAAFGSNRDLLNNEELITILIGKTLTLKKVIIKDIVIDRAPKFEKGGNTISAIASVNFQTFEIITKETIDSIYTGSSANEIFSESKPTANNAGSV